MAFGHAYWNLDAFVNPHDNTILNHALHLPYSPRYIGIDNIEVPTGGIGLVRNTPLDFAPPKQIGTDILSTVNNCGFNCTGYDNAFIIDRPRYSGPESTDLTIFTISSPVTGIQLDIKTNQQSVQTYSCNGMNGMIPVKESQQHEKGKTTYVPKYGCIVIETQQWIDGINHPEWGQDEYQIFGPETGPAVVWSQHNFSIVKS